MNIPLLENEDFEIMEKKGYNISCCRSYLTPKGRCYTCPENDFESLEEKEEMES